MTKEEHSKKIAKVITEMAGTRKQIAKQIVIMKKSHDDMLALNMQLDLQIETFNIIAEMEG